MNTSRVRKLAEVILANPKYVAIDRDRVGEVAKILSNYEIELPKWDFSPLYPQTDDFEEMCKFYLIFNSINYCYFDHDGKRFQDGKLRGSSLAAVRLTESWKDIQDPTFLSNVDENYLLTELFRAESPISLVKERAEALREVGRFLNENIDITRLFHRLFKRYKSNAYFVSQALPVHLPTWRDPFFKRAQLFVGMVYGRFRDWEDVPITRDSVDDLTVFADYRVPETLVRMGVIKLSAALMTRIHRKEHIHSGSRKELEIRAASIRGADEILNSLCILRPDEDLNALHMDYLLWSAGRRVDEAPENLFIHNHITHHYTMTTDY